jgi:hypothetical protein
VCALQEYFQYDFLRTWLTPSSLMLSHEISHFLSSVLSPPVPLVFERAVVDQLSRVAGEAARSTLRGAPPAPPPLQSSGPSRSLPASAETAADPALADVSPWEGGSDDEIEFEDDRGQVVPR